MKLRMNRKGQKICRACGIYYLGPWCPNCESTESI